MNAAAPRMEARFAGRLGGFELDAAFACPARGVTALFGPSGGGKTTLLRCIAGLARMRGAFRIDGEVWQDDDAGVFRPPHRRSIGYVFQESSLFPHLSVLGNLEYGFRRISARARRVTVGDAATLLGLGGLLARPTEGLSGGQRQRVAIARALVTSPQLLLLDEPLASLDHRSRDEILPYLERLHDELEMPVIYVSHAADEVARLADHLVLIEEGRVRAVGPLTEIGARLDLAHEFGAEVGTVIHAAVCGHDDLFRLSRLEFRGGVFLIPQMRRPVGRATRLRVLARDVSITLERQPDTSILNVFPATVVEIAPDGEAQVLVRLDLSGQPLLARITRKSCAALGLAAGKPVHVQVKAAALEE